MPWCDDCSRFWNPGSLGMEGTCPTCGRTVIAPPRLGPDGTEIEAEAELRSPWHFKLLVAAVVGYLGWRAVQGVVWVVEHV